QFEALTVFQRNTRCSGDCLRLRPRTDHGYCAAKQQNLENCIAPIAHGNSPRPCHRSTQTDRSASIARAEKHFKIVAAEMAPVDRMNTVTSACGRRMKAAFDLSADFGAPVPPVPVHAFTAWLSCPGRQERGALGAERMETRDPAQESRSAISTHIRNQSCRLGPGSRSRARARCQCKRPGRSLVRDTRTEQASR